MDLQWLLPGWIWPLLVLAAAGSVWWARRTYAGTVPTPPPAARRLLVGLRTLTCLLVLIAVARPLLIRMQAMQEPAVVAVVVEDSASMALRDRTDGPDRWSQAWSLTARIDSLIAAQGQDAELATFQGNGRLSLVARDLAEARVDTPRAVGTDLPALVAQARQQFLGQPLRAVIVIGDGHSESLAATSAGGAAPLHLVGVGDVRGPADRYLADLRYPDAVHRGEPLTVEVSVGQRWGAETSGSDSLRVWLRHAGEVVAAFTAPAGDLVRRELVWTPEETGLAVLEVEVAPLDNERFPGNNRATLAVDVQKDRARMLLLAPLPGWDVRFVAQAVRRESRLQLTVVRPGPTGPVLADSLTAWEPPASAEAWLDAWDGVVLVGPPGAWLPDAGFELAKAVTQGLGLCVLAGDVASDYRARPWSVPLLRLLPVETTGDRMRSGEFFPAPTAAAPRHPVLAGVTHGPDAGSALAGLPPLRRLQPARARAGAEVLLVVGQEQPLLAATRPGTGRVLWFGGRRLWEQAFWQLPAQDETGDHPGRRLLRQMLLWTALGDQESGISLLGQRLVYEEGEPLPVAARWRDMRGEPVTGRDLVVELSPAGGGAARTFTLRPDPARPGISAADLPPLPPGRWQLTPGAGDGSGETGEPRDIVVTRAERERAQVQQDRRNLRQTADRLGGVYHDAGRPDDVDRLLNSLAGLDLESAAATRQDRHEPAAGWPWLAAAVALLAAEWLLRRRHGLL